MSVYPAGADVVRGAELSRPEPGERRLYRYSLLRRWGPGEVAIFVMLNPSVADADVDDPTVRRCVGFARALGCDALRIVNLYAYRTKDPAELRRARRAGVDVVGPENDGYLAAAAVSAFARQQPLVAAWGAHAEDARVAQVLALSVGFEDLRAFGVTRDGQPRHPLRLPRTARLAPWPTGG